MIRLFIIGLLSIFIRTDNPTLAEHLVQDCLINIDNISSISLALSYGNYEGVSKESFLSVQVLAVISTDIFGKYVIPTSQLVFLGTGILVDNTKNISEWNSFVLYTNETNDNYWILMYRENFEIIRDTQACGMYRFEI